MPAADAGLDELHQAPAVRHDVRVLRRPPRGRERLLVAAMPVVHQRDEPGGQGDRRPVALRDRARQGFVGQRLQPRLIAARRGQRARRVPERREPGRLSDRTDLLDLRRSGAEGAGMDVERGEVVERVREQVERAGVTREAHAAGRERVPELVVPEILREAARQPEPAAILSAAAGFAERPQRPRERRDGRRVPLGEPRHEGVEEQVGRALGLRAGRRARGLGDLALVRTGSEAPGVHRRRDRLEVGLAGHLGVERIEPPGRLQQQRRRVAPAPAPEHDLRAQPLQPRALELVDRPERGAVQQVGRGRGVGHVELRLRRGERALHAPGGVWGQLGGALQERGGRGEPATALRALRGARHLGGDLLVRNRRRVRAMPGAPVGVDGPVGRVGERPVHVAAVARMRRAIDRRADERMREAHACVQLDQTGRLGRLPGLAADTEPVGGAPQQAQVAQRLGRRRQEQELRLARKRLGALEEGVLDAARQRSPVGEPEPARDLCRRQPARQLDQRERVAAGLAEDPGLHPLVERPRDGRVQKQPGLVGSQPLDRRAPATPRARAGRRTRATRTPIRPARPTAGAPRTTASARTPGRASGRRRRCTRAAAPRRRRPAGSGPPAPRGSGPVAARRSGRTPCSARRAAGSAGARDGRASARTAHAGRRRAAPSRTRRLPPGRSGSPSRLPTGAARGRSCRLPPRRGGPAHGSGPCAPPRGVAPAPRARRDGRPTPMMMGGCRPCWRSIICRLVVSSTGRA